MQPKDIAGVYTLSPVQQGMFFETLFTEGLHLEQSLWRISGDLDPKAFAGAWQRVLDRHPALRTVFVWKGQQQPLQVVLHHVKLPLEQQDWRSLGASEQQERLRAYLAVDRQQGFILSHAPLLRLALLRLAEDAYQIVWTYHHLLLDGWSVALVVREVMAYYLDPQQPNVPSGASHQTYRTWLQQQDLSQAENFWRQELRGFTRPTPLGKRAPVRLGTEGYGEAELRFQAPLTARLQALARREHLTLNTLLQGVWALLLSRYSGMTDVVFGTTVAGRPPQLPGVETMVGLWINTLPVRLSVVPEAACWAWLRALQEHNLAREPYTYCSSGQVHQWSDSPMALYDSLLVFENYPVDLAHLARLPVKIQSTAHRGAQTKFPLTLLAHIDQQLHIQAIYQAACFDAPDIAQVLNHLQGLLTHLTTDSSLDLATLLASIPPTQIPKFRMPPVQSQDYVAPRTEVERTLVALWAEVLGREQVGIHDNFFMLGGHSLLAVQLMTLVQQRFGRADLPLSALLEGPTIARLARALSPIEPVSWSPLVPIQSGSAHLPFFCVHPAGGAVLCYADLARHLGSDQPFYSLQAQGLTPGQQPQERIEEIAHFYLQAVRTLQPKGPYLLGGWSFGGLVAYEMAQQLQALGQPVGLLALLDTRVPDHAPVPDQSDAQLLIALYQEDLDLSATRLEDLDPEAQLHYVLEQAKQAHLVPAGLDLERVRCLLKVFRMNQQAAQVYVPQPYVGQATVFWTEQSCLGYGPTLGWGALCQGGVATYPIAGTHLNLVRPPHVTVLAQRLGACLKAVTPSTLPKSGWSAQKPLRAPGRA